MDKPPHTHAHGFTLVELIAVIVVASIIGGLVVTPLVTAPKKANLYAERDRLLTDIRYTQSLAMFSNRRYRLDLSQSNQYRILDNNGNALNYIAAGGQSIALQSGSTVSINTTGKYLVFSGRGVPAISSSANGNGTNTSSNVTITISNSGVNLNLTVLPQTGYSSAS